MLRYQRYQKKNVKNEKSCLKKPELMGKSPSTADDSQFNGIEYFKKYQLKFNNTNHFTYNKIIVILLNILS